MLVFGLRICATKLYCLQWVLNRSRCARKVFLLVLYWFLFDLDSWLRKVNSSSYDFIWKITAGCCIIVLLRSIGRNSVAGTAFVLQRRLLLGDRNRTVPLAIRDRPGSGPKRRKRCQIPITRRLFYSWWRSKRWMLVPVTRIIPSTACFIVTFFTITFFTITFTTAGFAR